MAVLIVLDHQKGSEYLICVNALND